jgi:hypothetical protein
VHGDVLSVLKRSGMVDLIGRDNFFPAEANPHQATRKALIRAQALLGTAEADIRIYHSQPTVLGTIAS